MAYLTEEELERFNSFWEEDNGCHFWQGYLDKDGYGDFYFRKKLRRAHRVAYYSKNGDIPSGMFVDHTCRTRNCVNLDHLKIVTPRENALNNSLSVGAINARKTHCKNGHPFDRKYGKQRYCSICENNKRTRLQKKWREEANQTKC